MRKLITVQLFVLFFMAFSEPSIAAYNRVALVIGNGLYNESPLKNPENDAKAMAQNLKQMGFEVELITNAKRRDMVLGIRRFGKKLTSNVTGLFYFAGHGLQLSDQNYLVPTDAEIESEADIEFEAVSLGRILNEMGSARNGANIVILDACRNNPYNRSFRSARGIGLKRVDGPNGTIIAYATAPGSVAADGAGENGLYTTHLLNAMKTPGRPIEFVFKDVAKSVKMSSNGKQMPWYSAGSFTGEFNFVNLEEGAPSQIASAQKSTKPKRSDELIYWDSIKNSEDPESFQKFVEEFPDGEFTELAQMKITNLNFTKSEKSSANKEPEIEQPNYGEVLEGFNFGLFN